MQSTIRIPGFIELEENIKEDIDDFSKPQISQDETVNQYLKRLGADKIKVFNTSDLYHLVSTKTIVDNPSKSLILQPRIPRYPMEGEDRIVSRVCFINKQHLDEAINLALKALELSPLGDSGDKLAVYKVASAIDVLVPTTEQLGFTTKKYDKDAVKQLNNLFRVPDSNQTSEVWSLKPTLCKLVDVIEIRDYDEWTTDKSDAPVAWKRRTMRQERKNPIKGGIGDKLSVSDVDKNELRMGLKVEMEHTDDPDVALDIVLDHLKEDPKYYTKLKKIEPEENEGVDAIQTMKKLLGSLSDEHPGSSGKDLSAYEGAVGPIAPRKIGSTAPHDDEEMCEDVQDDLGVKLTVEDNGDEVSFWLTQKGKKKGVVTVIEDSHIEGFWEVYNSDFDLDKSGSMLHKGLGTVVYPKINAWLKKNKNSRLSSDVTRSEAAEGLWQKLANLGKAKHKNLGISKNLDVYYFSEAWAVLSGQLIILENILLVEDSRGNMKNILKAPPRAIEKFHKEYGSFAFPMMKFFLSKLMSNRKWDNNRQAYTPTFDTNAKFEQAWSLDEKHIDSVLRNFELDDSKRLLKALKDSPGLVAQVNQTRFRWSSVDNMIASYSKPNTQELLKRAQSKGITFSDGFIWIPLNKDECDFESNIMQHCGEDESGQMWSLRDKTGMPHVTMTYDNFRKTVNQIKGKQNTAPNQKYWSYIKEFFKKMHVKSIEDTELADTAEALFTALEDICEINKGNNKSTVAESFASPWSTITELLAEKGMRIDVKETKEDGDNVISVTLFNLNNKIGYLKAYFDDRLDAYKVQRAEVNKPGEGIGEEFYKEVDRWLQNQKGKRLASDFFREQGAEGLWQKLVRQGKAAHKVISLIGSNGKKISDKDYFIFKT